MLKDKAHLPFAGVTIGRVLAVEMDTPRIGKVKPRDNP
jgi:hypothetical protein